MAQAAEYKGRKYKLIWIGQTKYGRRAHLGFWDGSKDFWVSADAVNEVSWGRGSNGDDCPCNHGGDCLCGSDAPCCMCG